MQKARKHSILQAFNLFCIDLRGEGWIRTPGGVNPNCLGNRHTVGYPGRVQIERLFWI
jgi:hypothetical protein